ELLVDGLPRAEADLLRTAVLTKRSRLPATAEAEEHPDAGPATEPEEEFARFDNRWLLYAPLVGGYLAVPLAAVGALSRVVDEVPDGLLPDVDGPSLGSPLVAVAVAAVAVAVLAVGAVVGAAVVNWRFRLVRRGGSLVA